jgi:hypothetical protein
LFVGAILGRGIHSDPGVIERDVDSGVLLHDLLSQSGHLFGLGEINLKKICAQLIGRLGSGFSVYIYKDDFRAVIKQSSRGLQSNPASSAGDHSNPAVERGKGGITHSLI